MAEGTVRVPIPDPNVILAVASDGQAYAVVPVSRALLASAGEDFGPTLLGMLDDGLEQVRRDRD